MRGEFGAIDGCPACLLKHGRHTADCRAKFEKLYRFTMPQETPQPVVASSSGGGAAPAPMPGGQPTVAASASASSPTQAEGPPEGHGCDPGSPAGQKRKASKAPGDASRVEDAREPLGFDQLIMLLCSLTESSEEKALEDNIITGLLGDAHSLDPDMVLAGRAEEMRRLKLFGLRGDRR